MRRPSSHAHLTTTNYISAVATGNVTVAFTALSYAGSLVITISADPDTCPDLDRLQHELQRQLNLGIALLLN